MKPTIPLLALSVLACSGLGDPATPVVQDRAAPAVPSAPLAPAPEAPIPPAPPAPDTVAWVDQAVGEALAWEVMPGTTDDPDDGTRAAALRTFFLAHPEYADAARRAPLADHACAIGTEASHERITKPPARVPLEVAVDKESWRLVVAHSAVLCTSDDWSWYTHEVGEAVGAMGIQYEHAEAENDVVIVRRGGAEVARLPLEGQGYVVAGAGRSPLALGHDMSAGVIEAVSTYFGTEAPARP